MKLYLVLFFSCLSLLTTAQDYHHWSEHFGARASMLGGAATAGLGDNATTFYNPAAMAFVKDPSLSISVNAYRFRTLQLENALGDGLNLRNNQFSTMPNLIAGILTLKKHKKVRLGYCVLTRRAFSSKFDYLYEGKHEILANASGLEEFVASYNFQHRLMEYWAGLGVSWQVSENLSIGLAHYGMYRDVKYSNAHQTDVLPTDLTVKAVSSVSTNVTFNYYNVKGNFRPSIALNLENFRLGVSGTTPAFNILGKANVYREFSIINIDQYFNLDVTFKDRATRVKARHKDNGSLAIGVSWKLGKKTWFHFSHETFFGGKKYYIYDVDERPNVYPNVIADTAIHNWFGKQNFLSLTEETEARTNIGLGLEAQVAKNWDLYLGARTDFMFNERPYYTYEVIGVESSKWNLFHFSLGIAHLTKKNKRYTVGLEYGVAPRRNLYHVIDFRSPSLDNLLLGNGSDNLYANSHSFKLLLEIEVGAKRKGD